MRAFRRVATVLGVAFLLSLTAPAGAATPGRAWAVGNNTEGQLGDGTLTPRSVPAEVLGLSGVQAVAAGSTHSLALRGDGTVWSWGYNANGQLGDGTIIGDRVTPVRVVGLSGVRAIAAGFYNGFALLTDGTVWAWGAGPCGELGDGDTFSQNRPVRSFRNLRVKAVAAGANHTLALLPNGTVRAVGCNASGQLGDGTSENIRVSPVRVAGLGGVQALAAGSVHSLALLGDGTVRGWGNNELGQLGDGTVTNRLTPVPVPGLAGVAAIAAGANHNLAALGDGTVRGWGNNGHGQLGDGAVNIVQPTPVTALRLAGVKGVAGGWFHSLART